MHFFKTRNDAYKWLKLYGGGEVAPGVTMLASKGPGEGWGAVGGRAAEKDTPEPAVSALVPAARTSHCAAGSLMFVLPAPGAGGGRRLKYMVPPVLLAVGHEEIKEPF